MSTFNFTTPSGQRFKITGPAGATEDQARTIFNKQFDTGSLVGLKSGDIVNADIQASNGLTTALALASQSLTNSNIGNIFNPVGVVVNPINAADFVKQDTLQISIGTLNPAQVQGLVAQAAVAVGQSADEISNDKGLGKFGFNATQLQTAGLIKPGVADQITQNPLSLTSTLASPAVWTGKYGATNLNTVLADPLLQNKVQQGLMGDSLSQLKQLGTVSGTEPSAELGTLVQMGTKFGAAAATSFAKGTPLAGLVNQLNVLAKQSVFSINFADLNSFLSGGTNPLQTGIQPAKGFTNTVNRSTVNAGVAGIINNPKIPKINFGDLYVGVSDTDLVYTGTDPIVLARINQAREKRGLAPL